MTTNKQSIPSNDLQGTQNQPVLPSFFMVDELPDEEIKNDFMSEEYYIGLLTSLEMNAEQDDLLHVVDKEIPNFKE